MSGNESASNSTSCCSDCCYLFTRTNEASPEEHRHVIYFSRTVGGLRRTADDGCPFCILLCTDNAQLTTIRDAEETHDFTLEFGDKAELSRHAINVPRLEEVNNVCTDIVRLRISNRSVIPKLEHFDVLLLASTTQDDPAARYVSTRPIEHDCSSEVSFTQARLWMQDCLDNHSDCHVPSWTDHPARLIDVGDDINNVPEIHLSRGCQDQKYAALSYCWGQAQDVILTTLNCSKWHDSGISICDLPHTLQDAIAITRKLGLRFIWIDALCIMQDSESDKNQEIGKMGEIYQNAIVTIVAAGAQTCYNGIFHSGTTQNNKQFSVPFKCRDGKMGSLVLEEWQEFEFSPQSIDSRAWTLQERLLSPRILKYTADRLFWECQTVLMSNGGVHSRPEARTTRESLSFVVRSERLPVRVFQKSPWREAHLYSSKFEDRMHKHQNDVLAGQFHDYWLQWRNVLEDYTSRSLSLAQDRLRGLSGIANHFHAALPTDETYMAGLWINIADGAKQFIADLMWQCEFSKPRPTEYVAPSWSWAGHPGHSIWKAGRLKIIILSTVLSWSILLESINLPFGRVQEGSYLEIRGPLKAQVHGMVRWKPGDHYFIGDETLHLNEMPRRWLSENHFSIVFDEVLTAEEVLKIELLALTNATGLALLPVEGSLDLFRRVGLVQADRTVELVQNWEIKSVKII